MLLTIHPFIYNSTLLQNCFLEHKHESSGLIVTLIGEDYIYRGDFYHEGKNEPHVEEQLCVAIYDLISKYKVPVRCDEER